MSWISEAAPIMSIMCCGFGMYIPDPNYSIPDPGSRVQKDSGSRIRIRINELKYFLPIKLFLSCRKNDLGWSWSGSWFFTHPGSRGQKSTGSRIRNTRTGMYHIFVIRQRTEFMLRVEWGGGGWGSATLVPVCIVGSWNDCEFVKGGVRRRRVGIRNIGTCMYCWFVKRLWICVKGGVRRRVGIIMALMRGDMETHFINFNQDCTSLAIGTKYVGLQPFVIRILWHAIRELCLNLAIGTKYVGLQPSVIRILWHAIGELCLNFAIGTKYVVTSPFCHPDSFTCNRRTMFEPRHWDQVRRTSPFCHPDSLTSYRRSMFLIPKASFFIL